MVTLQKIAQLANVSIGTVDRVIHNRGRVSKETETKIRNIVKELDYKPNILAQSLSLSKTREYHFGVLIPKFSQDGKYWELPLRGINKAKEELTVYKVKTIFSFYDKYSESSFEKAFNTMVFSTNKLDGLVISPVLSHVTEELIKKIPPELPYVFLDSYIPNSKCISYIGEESYNSGILAAKLMNMLIKESGTVAAFNVIPKDNHINDRVSGFLHYMQEHSGNKIEVYIADRISDKRAFYNMTNQIVDNCRDLQGIFVPISTIYQVAEHIKNISPDHKVFLIGYDLIEENLSFLKDGIIDFLISQRSELQGYLSIVSLFNFIALNQKANNKIMVPFDILTKENVDFYHV
ncbi:MAG TPA: substrate-binding domain-containing protein [bacterium]|nr:substrate-binding domain-containing protein [bacterium]HPN44947.1 substrate-binding domain-containing protein [bacterium]